MVALRQYKPQNLQVNPFAVATQLADPIDVNGVLKEISAWNTLSGQEANTEAAQIQLQQRQNEQDFNEKRKEVLESKLVAGEDPSIIDPAEIEKTIGNVEGYLKLKKEAKEAQEKQQDRDLKISSTLSKIGKDNPEYAQQLAGIYKVGNFIAPPQKSKEGKEKEVKPSVIIDPQTNQAKILGVPEGQPVPAKLAKELEDWNMNHPPSAKETATAKAAPGITDQVSGFLSSLTGGQATPAATPSAIPSGMKLQRNKVTGETRLVPING